MVIVARCPETHERRQLTLTKRQRVMWSTMMMVAKKRSKQHERDHSNGMVLRNENYYKVQIYTKYQGKQQDRGELLTIILYLTNDNIA